MPIEFRCTHCNRLLRTPDGTSGKDAKCPECGAVVKIPASTELPAALPPIPEPAPPRADTGNPYQSPGPATEAPLGNVGEIRRGFDPTRIDLSDMLSRTWTIFKANLWPLVGATLLVFAVYWVSSIVMGVSQQNRPPVAVKVLLVAVPVAINFWLTLGLLLFMLKKARGEAAEFADLFNGTPFLLPAAGVAIISFIFIWLGFALLIIPGIIVALMLSQSMLILLDQRVGVIEALQMSREATNGNKLTLLGLYLVVLMLSIPLGIFTCGVGLLFMHPFAMLLSCVTYLSMTGQSTAAPAYAR